MHPTTTTTMLMRMILSIVHQRGSSCESESAAVEVLQQRRERAILQRLDEKLPAGSYSQYCFLTVCMYVCMYMPLLSQVIPAMLEDGIRVLIYAGDVDFICNW